MKLRRLRIRLAVLFGLVAAALSIGPLLLWHGGRVDAINDDFEDGLIEQMEEVQRNWVGGVETDLDFPVWQVESVDGWSNPLSESDLEPPLISWSREVRDEPQFRSFSQDGERFSAYVNPVNERDSLITVAWAGDLDNELSAANRRTLVWSLGLIAVSLGLGWLGAGLALGPTKRMIDGQQGFLADAAHEMRTPLAVIMASSSQALGRPRTDEEYVRSLSEIRSAAERASTGVNELLDLVRFDSGQAIPRLAPLRLDLLAEEVAASIRPEESEVIAEPSNAVVVNADMALLRQALDNVVRNAVRRAGRVELTSRVEDRFGVVQVADDGPGFDESKLPVIFDRYQRGDRQGDSGIGLAIVKAIVEANGGTVAASNGPGGGAVITMRIPLAN